MAENPISETGLAMHRLNPTFRREAGATQDARVVRIAGRKAF